MFQRRQKSVGLRARYGMVEVLRQLEPEPARRAARDVGVGREVRVDLDREREDAGPEDVERRIATARRPCWRSTPTLSAMTSFLKKPQQIRTKPLARLLGREAARRLDLRQQERRALNRAGDEVREERDEHGDVEQAAARAQLAAIDVDGVAHRLERVERDADRQEDAQRRLVHGRARTPPARAATFSTKKLKYLKNPSMPKFEMTLSHRKRRRCARPAPPSRARRSSR